MVAAGIDQARRTQAAGRDPGRLAAQSDGRCGDDAVGGGQYAIHGTNQPGLIGGFVSHGCIRMYNADITDLLRPGQRRHDGGGDQVTDVRRQAPNPGASAAPR